MPKHMTPLEILQQAEKRGVRKGRMEAFKEASEERPVIYYGDDAEAVCDERDGAIDTLIKKEMKGG